MSVVHDDHRRPEAPLGNSLIKYPLIGRLFRLLTWWLIFTGIYASSSLCPFCGRTGCPVGGVSACILGGAFALVLEKGRAYLSRLAGTVSQLRAQLRLQTKA
jgi:hypothetical protein